MIKNDNIYYKRLIDKVIIKELEAFGAVLIEGPKWSGKTTSSKLISKSFINFQDQDNQNRYIEISKLNISTLLLGDKPRLIDEWQVIPSIWDAVRQDIDKENKEGLYILTGSSKVDSTQIMHSGVGRISKITMRTMSLYESKHSTGEISISELFRNKDFNINFNSSLSIKQISELIVKGGWPKTIDKNLDISLRQNKGYIDMVANIEMKSIDGVKRDSNKVFYLLRSLARNSTTAVTHQTLIDDVRSQSETIHANTVSGYLDKLKELYIIEELDAWNPRLRSKSTIRKRNVIHFVEPSLAASLLGATPNDLLNDPHTFGLLFESLVIRDLRIYTEFLDAKLYHYHDSSGLEADAIIHLPDGKWAAVEIKLSHNSVDQAAKNLLKLKSVVDTIKQPSALIVIVATGFSYQREDGVYVIPIGLLKP